jgi:hypothetical protein
MALAHVFEDIAGTAADADLGDERQDDVFGRHTGLQAHLRRAPPSSWVWTAAGTGSPARVPTSLVPMPKGQRAECAVRAGVAVTAHNRHARLGEPCSGPITWTMP